MTKFNPTPDPTPDPNPDPANDNGGAIAPVSKGSLLASTATLAALVATFKTVDTTSIGGRPVKPLLQFKSREGGIWTIGQRRTLPEPGSRWAVDPASFLWGWVCWGDNSKILGNKLVPISQPLPDGTALPDKGFPWQTEMVADLKCISGIDAGLEVTFKTNTVGGKGELTQLIDAVQDRLAGNSHDGKVAPVVQLEADSYPHREYGKTWVPLLPIMEWRLLDGPAPAPSAPPPPKPPVSTAPATEQPRRRRVA